MNHPQLRVSHLSDDRQFANSINGALRRTDALSLSSDQTALGIDRNIDVTGVVKVNGTQVVGARQIAIADDSSGAINQPTVNAILAALRAHGLIA